MVAFNIEEQAFRSVMRERERQALIEMIRELLGRIPKPPRVRHAPSPQVKDYLVPEPGYRVHAKLLGDPQAALVYRPEMPFEPVQYKECGVYVYSDEPAVCPCGEVRWTVKN